MTESENTLAEYKAEADRLKKKIEKLSSELGFYKSFANCSYNSEAFVGPDRCLSYVSPSCLDVTGYPEKDFYNDPDFFMRIAHPEDKQKLGEFLGNIAFDKPEDANIEIRILTKDHKVKWIHHFIQKAINSEGDFTGYRITNMDITDRKKTEEQYVGLNRLYSVISQIDKVIFHERTRNPLFKEICRVTTGNGWLLMAWIGLVDNVTNMVIPVAFSGHEDGYLTSIKTISTLDKEEGRGPTGRSIREGKYVVCNDIENDPLMGPWRHEALIRGYRSMIGMPVRVDGNIIGAFSVYAPGPDFFNQEEISLLLGITDDIGFALESIETEEKRRAYEIELLDSREKLRTAQNIARTGSWSQQFDGSINWSDEMYRIFGLKRETFKPSQDSILNFVHPDDKELCAQWSASWSGDNSDNSIDFRIMLHDTTIRYVNGRAGAILEDPEGRVFISGTLQDITERKELEKQLQISNFAIKSSLSAIGLASLDGIITSVNDSFMRLWGYSSDEELIGKSIAEFALSRSIPDAEKTDLFISELKCGHGVVREESTFRKDGKPILVEMTATLVKCDQGGPISIMASFQDITERKMAEEEIRKLNEELEHRVIERTRQLNVVNKELETFNYSVSHDLRAPLRTVSTFGSVLLEDYSGILDDRGTDIVERIVSGSKRMTTLVDDLMNLSLIASAEMDNTEVDLSDLANNILCEFRLNYPERKINMSVQEGLKIKGDRGLLDIMLRNLLMNSFKYTGRKEIAVIEFKSFLQDGETVYFVRDNGAGFDMQHQDKLFKAFHRLHNSSEFEGTGIGLATAERVLNRHGGRIWAEAEVDKGATFYFTIKS